MTDAERTEHLIAGLGTIDSLAVQLAAAMTEAVGDIEALSKAAFRGGGVQRADRQGGAISIGALHALVRGRLRGLGCEQLLERTTQSTDPGWVENTATRLRRVLA